MKKLWLSALLLAGFVAYGAEIYVSPSGSDKNPGTAKAPLQKVQSAFNKVKPGDTIKLLPGVYREENLTLTKSGTADKPIRIEGLRDSKGQYLAVLEPAGKVLKNWQKAPEIGEDIWKTPLAKRPDLVLLDGAMIALINRANMVLPRRKPLPEKFTEELLWGDYSPKTSKRLSGLDLLALKKDILVSHQYFRTREELLWPVLGYVLCGWHEGNLYIRFANGSSPEKHNITASYGSGMTIKNAANVVLDKLCMRGSTIQLFICGKSKNITVQNSMLMHGSCRIRVEKTASDVTIRDNILTCGFIQNEHFKLRSADDMRGGLVYLIFKYIIGTATSDDAGIMFYGKNCRVYNNVIVNGLLGVDGGGPGAKVYGNCIKGMSSCGIITGTFSSGEYYENLVMDSGIPLRIHDWRHEKFYRTEYHYRNMFVQAPHAGSMIHIYSASNKVGPDKVNFDKDGIYKENPPAPFDPGKIFIYHNTFVGGTDLGNPFPARAYFKRFREKPMPFYVVNNIIKSAWSWDMRHQDMLAGNLLYIGKKPHRVPAPHDKTVQDFNRISPTEKLESIWKDLYAKPITDIVPGANSPALECGVDVSKDMDFRGLKVQALPGFKPGYFTGKAPAAGAVQPGDEKLMEHFRNLYVKMQNAMEIIKNQR